jgi:hypothetical protein
VTLHIDNQKNGQRGQTVHHSAVNAWFCPAKACARHVHEIRSAGLPPDTPLSFLGNNTHAVAVDILNAVRLAARQTNLPANGYDLTRIGAHSIRASGAMTLKLNGYDKETSHHENWLVVKQHISNLHSLSNCSSHYRSRGEDDSIGAALPNVGS